jgi:hypothetical protein
MMQFHTKRVASPQSEEDPGMATTPEQRLNRDHNSGKGFVEGTSPTVDMGLGWLRLGGRVYPVTLLAVPPLVQHPESVPRPLL